MTITDQQLKSIAAAVLIQTAKDYKQHPEWRASIEKWISEGNVWTDVVLPDYSENYIIKALRNSLKSNQEKQPWQTSQ